MEPRGLEQPEQVVVAKLTNSRGTAVKFYLEPWGQEALMPAGAAFDIVARGPRTGTLGFDFAADHIVVWGWGGSLVDVSRDGTPLWPPKTEELRVPQGDVAPRTIVGLFHDVLGERKGLRAEEGR